MMKANLMAMLLLISGLCGCSVKGLYYFPNNELFRDPAQEGLAYEMVRFPSANGKSLFGLYFRAEAQPPKGIIIHFHGNYGNVSHHYGQSVFLLRRGFDVFIFDYQGYGASEGKPRPERTIEDGLAAIRFLETSTIAARAPIGLFGQSIGAAIATVVAARSAAPRAVLLEAGFDSYKGIMKDVMKRSWLLKPFSFFVPALIAQRGLDPVDFIGKISPRPVYVVHGDKDRVVPFRMGENLIAASREPKTFRRVVGADHLQCKAFEGGVYENEAAGFFADAFAAAASTSTTGTGAGRTETPGSIPPARK